MILVREPDAVTPHVRFDEGDVEPEHGVANIAPAAAGDNGKEAGLSRLSKVVGRS